MAEIKEQALNQPDIETQKLYLSLINNDAEEVQILRTKKKYKIHWLKNGQLEKLTRLLIHKKDIDTEKTDSGELFEEILSDIKLCSKAAAIIILDGYWKLKFRYWFLWRWFYYIKQYDNIQLSPILDVGKKKVPQMQFFQTIMSLTEAKDSLMRMRAKEVEAILQERSTVRPSQTENNDSGS